MRLEEQRLEHEEKYRIALYDKRLAVHQRAYEWMQRLQLEYANAHLPGLGEDRSIEARKRLQKIFGEARQWWTANCLYLDLDSRSTFIAFTFQGLVDARKSDGSLDADKWKEVFGHWEDTIKAIERGIGEKHIDFGLTRVPPRTDA